MTTQEKLRRIEDLLEQLGDDEAIKRLEGVKGPERRLVGPAAKRVEQSDGVEVLREDSGVEPGAKQSLCPFCKHGVIESGSFGFFVFYKACPFCGGKGQRSGRLNAEPMRGQPLK